MGKQRSASRSILFALVLFFALLLLTLNAREPAVHLAQVRVELRAHGVYRLAVTAERRLFGRVVARRQELQKRLVPRQQA